MGGGYLHCLPFYFFLFFYTLMHLDAIYSCHEGRSVDHSVVTSGNEVLESLFQFSKHSGAHFHVEMTVLESASAYVDVQMNFRSHETRDELPQYECRRFVSVDR